MTPVQMTLPIGLAPTPCSRLSALRLAVLTSPTMLADVLDVVRGIWAADVESGDWSEQTYVKFSTEAGRFEAYAKKNGALTLDDAYNCYKGFIRAYGSDRRGRTSRPSPTVQHLRGCAVRALFATARSIGLTDLHPEYLPRSADQEGVRGRPLTATEAESIRAVGRTMLHTRVAAAAAVALCGGGTTDIGSMTPSDVNLDEGVLHLPGGGRVRARTVAIAGTWEREVLAHRLASIARFGDSSSGLVVRRTGSAASRQAGAAVAISTLLREARVSYDPAIKPASIQRWAALVAFEHTSDIGHVARLLGVASLDTAASAIGWDWSTNFAIPRSRRPDFDPRVIA